MIQRVNFIEKKRLAITYRMIANAYLVAIGICGLLYGYAIITYMHSQKTIRDLQLGIVQLQKEKEKLMKKEKKNTGTGPFVAIQDELEQVPQWSLLLDSLSQILPHQVWLKEFKTRAQEKEGHKREVQLEGQAKNAQAISTFLKMIEDTPFFEDVVLRSSEEDKTGVFDFEISCNITENPTG